ncbi:uncharacterized protein B0H18DRAFT_302749 [Fomitopsis serialis]|uniref:uncharacterized protein n=1 Tax=Fomitopsis serialis TaxID=139415 RepID=UPI00200810B1|nr:uncharacterized protein B0H18DRAFT_302749 [Neoantrodia serialis]KAH9926896.1 hypothetical protein B0H18DRAFT_302749 [Neoantrodia serialis]
MVVDEVDKTLHTRHCEPSFKFMCRFKYSFDWSVLVHPTTGTSLNSIAPTTTGTDTGTTAATATSQTTSSDNGSSASMDNTATDTLSSDSTDSATPSPTSVQPSLSTLPSSTPSSSSSSAVSPTSAADISTSRHTNTGAIAGGIIGGLVGLLLLLGLLLWVLRTRRRRKIAPSSEFLARSAAARTAMFSQTRMDTHDDADAPPPFARGTFIDPIAEKVREAEGHRSLWRGPNEGPEFGHWHYGPRQDAEDLEGVLASSPATERFERSEKSFLIL